jgi:hypothetical protein
VLPHPWQVYLYNVSVAYLNPSPLDNCQQYNSKALFGLRQAYGPDNVTAVNATGGNILGPVNITVLVSNASSNATRKAPACTGCNAWAPECAAWHVIYAGHTQRVMCSPP